MGWARRGCALLSRLKMLLMKTRLILFLLGYGVLLTLLCIRLERRLSRLEASYREVEWRYRVDSNTLAHVAMTPELLKSMEAAMDEEGRRLARTDRGLRPLGSELNSPPPEASGK